MSRIIWLLAVLAGGISGCYSPTPDVDVDEWERLSTSVGAQQGVTLVGTSDEVIKEIVACVETKLRDLSSDMRVISSSEFRDSLFPWLEPKFVPTDEESWAKLKARPLIKERIQDLRARYIVQVSGHSGKTPSTWGGIIGGPQAAVIVGGVDVKEEASVSATVIDWASVRSVAEIQTSATGHSGAGLIIIIPFFYTGPGAEKVACRTVARQVAAFLKGEARPPDDD